MFRFLFLLICLAVMVGSGVADSILLEPTPPSDSFDVTELWAQLKELSVLPKSDSAPRPAQETVTKKTTKAEPDTAGPVKKSTGDDMEEAIKKINLELKATEEASVLQQVVPETITLNKRLLLKDQDRVGAISWIETSESKDLFTALKQSLRLAFSSGLKDLVDEARRPPGRPVQNYFTFYDPAIANERLIFIRVRDRLYELHVAEGQLELIEKVIDQISR